MDSNTSGSQIESIVVQSSYDKEERVSRDKKKTHRRHQKTFARVAEDGTISTDVSSPGPPTSSGKSRRKTPKGDDVDDAASVCSSTSSEHSTKNAKSKKPAKSLTYCELHSNSTKQKLKILEESDRSGGNVTPGVPLSLASIMCTCTFKDTKSARLRGDRFKRPEPEGSILGDSYKGYGTMDEFERIIYCDDPMFSDLEEDPVVDEQIREESEKLHKKSEALGASRGGGDSLFSAAQSLNSSTIIKLAIIGNELKNVKDTSLRRAEGDMTTVSRRVDHLEQSFVQASDHLDLASKHLAEAIILLGYNREEVLKQMEPQNVEKGSRLGGGSSLDKQSYTSTSSASRKSILQQLCLNKLLVNDRDLEEAEEHLYSAELRVHEIEEEIKTVSGVKPRNCSEQEHKAWILRLKSELSEADAQATAIEEHILHLKIKLEKTEDERVGEKKKYKVISKRLNVSFAELSESFFE